jgi:DNA-binding SARP family transcriptional activator
MLSLSCLGAVELIDSGESDCEAVLRQPKRLAVLAYLACQHPGRYYRRDQLMAMFWPDLDQSHARASLRRAVHFLRRALGDDVPTGRGDDELAIPESAITCDVIRFHKALSDGHHETALDIYRGDFLVGVFVTSAPAFEEWMEEQRGHLRAEAAKAAWTLAERLEAEAPERAKSYAAMAVTMDPYDEASLRRQLALFDRLGDRAGAVQAYEEFATRYRADLEMEPAVETQHLITSIRTSGPRIQRLKSREPATAPQVVAIFPFVVRAPDDLAYLREGMVDLLTTKLDGAGALRGADPRVVLSTIASDDGGEIGIDRAKELAARLEAQLFLLGSVVVAGDSMQLNASLYDATGRVLHKAEAVGEAESEMFDLVDLLARQILASQGARVQRLDRVSAHTTEDLAALKAYLSGEQHFRAGHFFEAAEAFQQAVEKDPEFALSHHRLAASWAACAVPELARASAAAAYDRRARLSIHDRLMVEAQSAWLDGDAEKAEASYNKVVERYPDDVEAWFHLGDLKIHHNPYRGHSIREALPALRRAANLDPDHLNTLGHLARLAALERRTDELQDLARRIELLSPAGAPTLPIRALRAFALGDEDTQSEVLDELKDARALTIAVAFSDVALYAGNDAGTDRFADAFLSAARSTELQALVHIIRAHLALSDGGWKEAMAELDRVDGTGSAWALEVRGLFAALPFVDVAEQTVAGIAAEIEAWDPSTAPVASDFPLLLHNGLHPHLRHYLLALLAARLGDLDTAGHYAAALEDETVPEDAAAMVSSLIAGAYARVAWARGDHVKALALLEARRPPVWFQHAVASPFYAQAFERYMRGEVLQALGREAEARGWLQSLVERTPFELIYRSASHP